MDPFLQALPDPSALPNSVRDLHCAPGDYVGECEVERGRGLLVSLGLTLGRFPPAGQAVPVCLKVQRKDAEWYWQRDFGGHVTRSTLSYDTEKTCVHERLGALSIWLKPVATVRGLQIQIERMTLLGVPCPHALLPRSSTCEWQDDLGRFRFDVAAEMPVLGLLIRYHGHLTPVHRETVVS